MATIGVGIDRSWTVDLGTICDGENFSIKICNSDGGTHTATIQVCGCPQLSGIPTSETLNACECKDLTGTFVGLGYPNNGDCLIIISFNGKTSYINVRWQEVYCEPALSKFELSDASNINIINEGNFNPDCAVWTQGTMGEAKTMTAFYNLVQPVVPGDILYLSQWLFAQNPVWNYPNFPVAGWKYRVCEIDGEEPTVDGTFQMEWYGQAPSEENSQNTPYVTCIISNSGATIQYLVNFNLPEDSVSEPNNSGTSTHRMLLANTVQNELELTNNAENSIYANPKYLSWAFVLWRSVGNVYQDMILSIKGKLPFYGENVTGDPCVFRYAGLTLTTPTGQATDYFSTVRTTKVRVDFTYTSSNPAGTPPDAMWAYLIRNDSNNEQLNYYENYGYEQADLTSLTPSANITPITAPTNITGNDFFAEFDIAPLDPTQTGVEFISNNYRLIFVVIDQIDAQSRSDVSDAIQLINYDDENMTLPGLDVVFRTVEQQYAPTVTVLRDLPVNMELESGAILNLPLSDAEVSAKSGGLITTAKEAFQGARLRIYEQSPLTGQTLLNTLFYQPQVAEICGGTTQQNQSEPFVDRSSANTIDLTFPFTIPDNVYRKIGREGLFQSDASEPTNWGTLSLTSLNCVENRTEQECNEVLFPLPDVTGFNDPEYMAYVPDTNEVWVCNLASHTISIIDVATLTITATITLTAGDAPVGIVYVPQKGCYVTLQGANSTVLINIYTRSITATIATSTTPRQIIYASSIDKLFVFCSSANLYEIDPQTNTITNSLNTLQTSGQSITYYAGNDSLYTVANGSSDYVEIPRNTFVPSAPIPVPAQPFSIFASANNFWIATTNTIEVYDYTNTLITSLPYTGLGGRSIIENAGIIYVGDAGNNLVRLIDNTTFVEIATYPAVANPRRLLFGGGHLWLSQFTSDSVRPYLLDCNDSLPTFSMANKNILFNWDFIFQFFDNTETYTYQQKLIRPSPSRVADFVNDFVDIIIEEYQDDGTTVPIPSICATTNPVKITATLNSPKLLFSVGVDLEPIRGGLYTGESASSPISIPADSPYITNLTPAFGSTTTVEFDLNVPALPIQGDYDINLHFLLK